MRRRMLVTSDWGGGSLDIDVSNTKFIDLGLPSGVLVADRNLGAKEPWDAGYFFTWGNTEPYSIDTDPNVFSHSNYEQTKGYQFVSQNANKEDWSSAIMPATAEYDPVVKYYGSSCRLPNVNEFKYFDCFGTSGGNQYVDIEFIENYEGSGTNVYKVMKKTDHSVFIIFPSVGHFRSSDNEKSRYFDPEYTIWMHREAWLNGSDYYHQDLLLVDPLKAIGSTSWKNPFLEWDFTECSGGSCCRAVKVI